MAGAIHIPESDVTDIKSLLDMASKGDVIIERSGASFRLVRSPGRTAAEVLNDANLFSAMDALDENWSKDLEEIVASRKNEIDRDPWE